MNLLQITFLFIFCFGYCASAQPQKLWENNKSCAVCLTYDDAMPSHLDYAIPQLNKYNLKGTFYLTGSSETLYSRLEEWRKASENGHELGNHTLFHPCNGKSKNRDWVAPEKDLDTYTVNRFTEEVRITNTIIKAIDGKEKRSFAYTCGDTEVEGKNMTDFLPDYVTGARSTHPEFMQNKGIDPYNLPAFSCTGKTAEQMIALIEQAKQKNSLMILLFHGVGGGHLSVDKDEHEKVLRYLIENEKDIWVAPVVDLIEYIRNQ